MMILIVIIKTLWSRSQSFVIIWETYLLKAAVQFFLSSFFVEEFWMDAEERGLAIADSILHYLRYGLKHSLIDKNRHVKLNLLSEFEFLHNHVCSSIPVCQHEDFKHFLRVHSAKLFHQNIFSTPDYTYKVLQKLASNPDLVVLSGDKDSSVVIMQRADYVNKLETMIEEGIANGKYVLTEDNTLLLKIFWLEISSHLCHWVRSNQKGAKYVFFVCSQCYAAQHSYVPLLSLRRDSPSQSSPTFSVRPRSSVGRVTVDLIRRSWVRFSPRSKDFFFTSCGSLIPFTRANAQWVIHGFK